MVSFLNMLLRMIEVGMENSSFTCRNSGKLETLT